MTVLVIILRFIFFAATILCFGSALVIAIVFLIDKIKDLSYEWQFKKHKNFFKKKD